MRRLTRPLLVSMCLAGVALGKQPAGNGGNGPTVNLPQTMQDGSGNQWMVYQQGWLQMQGNNPVYGQSAQLMINGNQLNGRGGNGNRARVDDKTGELLFDFNNQGVSVTRRVQLNKKEGYVRYVDIVKNSRPNEQNLNLQVVTNLNFGLTSAEIVADPRKREHNLGYVGMSDGAACPVEIYASKNAKVTPNIEWQPGNNTVTAGYQLSIPPGKSVALLHIHTVAGTSEAGVKMVEGLKESKVVADLPADIRKMLVNFVSSSGMVGDFEVLRGEALDVVELRGGDQYKGTLQAGTWKLETSYGTVELPAERVVGVINVGDFRPRQLVVTTEGEIFGGHLAGEAVQLKLSSGQVTNVPLSQVGRVGYRRRAGEAEEWWLNKPMVVLRTGDRVQVEMPAGPVVVATRYGKLSLEPKAVAALVLASEEHGVHEVVLTDGSRFAGLVEGEAFEMTLAGGKQGVKFPANSVSRVQFGPTVEADGDAATLELTNGDKLVGQLAGEMKLETSFDTLTVNGAEVKRLTHPEASSPDVQVTLWDDSTLSGQLEGSDLAVKLTGGVTLNVPGALLADYNQPLPAPSSAVVEKIKTLVAALGAEDFKQRESAEAELTGYGVPVVRILKEMKGGQVPEAQQRIEGILKALEKKPERVVAPVMNK